MIYLLKSVGIPKYILMRTVDILGDALKNQGLDLAFSAKAYNQSFITNFENLFGRKLNSVKKMDSLKR
jgi:hypothetical protein